jgi:hypothetical protein
MVYWKPKLVHATGFEPFKCKLCLTDVISGDIVMFTKQRNNLP